MRLTESEGQRFRQQLSEVFKQLRKRGFVARQYFSCCGSCASYEIAIEKDGANHGKRVAFTHAQDRDGVSDGRMFVKYGVVISHAKDEVKPLFASDLDEREARAAAGREVSEVAVAAGLTVEWDGTPEKTVVLEWDGGRVS